MGPSTYHIAADIRHPSLDLYSDVIGSPAISSFLPSLHTERNIVDMSAAVFFGLRALSQTLTTQEALSGVFGSISLATWIFLLVCRVALD
jgi:hypothetical protein